MSTKDYKIYFDAKVDKLVAELKKAQKETEELKEKTRKAQEEQEKFEQGARKVAGVVTKVAAAVVAATAAFVAYATAQGRSIRETEALANMAGLTTEEFRRMSFVMGSVGLSAEKMGDIMKDTQERIGDFLATGGGPFQDFADVMGLTREEATALAREFETMSGDQVLQAMVTQMEDAGKSTQQMSFALEGMASDTTRLIPLLKENGRLAGELGEKFDELNIPLSEEEKAQFAQLATNVDLAQQSFVNFLNNAIAPFLPAINKAAEAWMEFMSAVNLGIELDQIMDDQGLVQTISDVNVLGRLLEKSTEELEKLESLLAIGGERNEESEQGREFLARAESYRELNAAIREHIKTLEDKAEAEKDTSLDRAEFKGSEVDAVDAPFVAQGVDGERIQEELLEFEKASQNRLQILEAERDKRLEIARQLYEDTAKYEELKAQIEQQYIEQAKEVWQTNQQQKMDALALEVEALRMAKEQELVTEEDYQQKLIELLETYQPEKLDPELLEEKNQLELEQLQEKLDNQLISYEDYYQKLAALGEKDAKDKEEKKKQENWWSESSVKKQIDDGQQLLSSLTANSKTAHRISQLASAATAGMNTAEGITKALAKQDYAGAALTAATGAAQVAAILSSSHDSPSSSGAASVPAEPQQEPIGEFNDQGITATDISGGGNDTTTFQILFNDEIVDALATKIKESGADGRT